MKRLERAWQTLQGELLFFYTRLVARTARWQIEGKANLGLAQASGHPLLWTLWHGQAMQFLLYGDRFDEAGRYVVVVVGDKRHRVLDILAKRLGAKTHAVDMQGNPVASGRAVLRVIQAMKRGKRSLIAPDGPDGPAFEAKPGVAAIARKAAAAILPVGMWTRHALHLRRWDRYLVPLPFARVHMTIGKPILARPDSDHEILLRQIAEALDTVRMEAQVAAGIEPWR